MTGKRKRSGSQQRLQGVTLCISTTMVLILLGMVVVSVLTAHNLSAYVKENLTVTLMLSDNVTDKEVEILKDTIGAYRYTKKIVYVSKEDAQREQSEAMGSDPSEFLGFNPFTATFEVYLKADYANGDSIEWITSELLAHKKITDVNYQEDLMDKVNSTLSKLSAILLVLAILLTCVSFSLINNTVRLGIYSRRFLIHTMKLVGASWTFIRRPFINRALMVGILASVLACLVLGGCTYALYRYEPNIKYILSSKELIITFASVFLFGLLITVACSYVSVNRFLKMTAGEIYKS